MEPGVTDGETEAGNSFLSCGRELLGFQEVVAGRKPGSWSNCLALPWEQLGTENWRSLLSALEASPGASVVRHLGTVPPATARSV